MGFFNNKNQNESAFVGGEKHWVDVIKNSGDGNLLVWRQPEEDFNTNSTLIVMPGEQAVFINQGNIEQVFTAGTYKLSTNNYPFISRLRNAFSGGVSTFNSVVYFVREADSREIEWGTMQPIRYGDAMLGPVNIKAGGAYKVKIDNPSLFITKLLGNNVNVASQDGLTKYFANEFSMHIADCINKTLNRLQAENYKEVYHYTGNLLEFANSVQPQLQSIMDDYGLKLRAFSISRCKDEYEDPEVAKMIADKKRMQYLGGNWAAQQQVDILKNVSTNEGAGGIASAGAGLGMGLSMGGVFGGMTQQVQQQAQAAPVNGGAMEKLKQLKELLDMGLISQSDFETKKAEILKTI